MTKKAFLSLILLSFLGVPMDAFALSPIPGIPTPPLSISTTWLREAPLNFQYQATITGSGGVDSYLWEVDTTSLPPGLSGAPEGYCPEVYSTPCRLPLLIKGTPTAPGIYRVAIKLKSAYQETTKTLELAVTRSTLEASPLSGEAPLTISYKLSYENSMNCDVEIEFEFGDVGVGGPGRPCGSDAERVPLQTRSGSHTYSSPGIYSFTAYVNGIPSNTLRINVVSPNVAPVYYVEPIPVEVSAPSLPTLPQPTISISPPQLMSESYRQSKIREIQELLINLMQQLINLITSGKSSQ